jgi:hypothetical protein
MAIVYVLKDGDEIRYVGKSLKDNPNLRLSEHLWSARNGRKTYVARWLRGLLRKGRSPTVEIIEKCGADAVADREISWIAKYRAEGSRLTNLTDGGEGTSGRVVSPTTRRIVSRRSLAANTAAILRRPEVAAKAQAAWRVAWADTEKRARMTVGLEIGRERMRANRRVARCHPERVHWAHDMCSSCWNKVSNASRRRQR